MALSVIRRRAGLGAVERVRPPLLRMACRIANFRGRPLDSVRGENETFGGCCEFLMDVEWAATKTTVSPSAAVTTRITPPGSSSRKAAEHSKAERAASMGAGRSNRQMVQCREGLWIYRCGGGFRCFHAHTSAGGSRAQQRARGGSGQGPNWPRPEP